MAVEDAPSNPDLQRENSRLRRELAEAHAREAATSEILRVIASSPANLQQVLDALAEDATRLCEAGDATIALVEGDVLRVLASYGPMARWWPDEGIPINRGSVNGRAVVDRQPVHVHDLAAESEDEFPLGKMYQRRGGHRTNLAIPLLREGAPVGVMAIRRVEVRPFTDAQIKLLESFAAQAVIAIENARLFTELQDRNRDLAEALEQQTATAAVLRVIASSPTDLQSLLDTIAASAARLCDASDATLMRIVDGALRPAARSGLSHGPLHDGTAALREAGGLPINRDSVSGRAAADRRPIHVVDLAAEPEAEFPVSKAYQPQFGYRTMLAAPLLRQGTPIGTITMRRAEVRPFTEKQIQLLETFADQAVIAIENARLFQELQERNRDLSEALEQQTATSEILRIIASSPTDLHHVLDALVASAARLCGADSANVQRLDGDEVVRLASTTPERLLPRYPVAGTVAERVLSEARTIHVHGSPEEQRAHYPESPGPQLGLGAQLSTPLLRGGEVVGVLGLARYDPRPFSVTEIGLLETFADQAVIAIENARLFGELQERNRELQESNRQVTEALEQQTATSEILRVIASSPAELQPVLDTVAENAARLCDATDAQIVRTDGTALRLVASHGPLPNVPLVPLDRGSVAGRAVVDRRTIHVPDLTAVEAEFPGSSARGRHLGFRAILATPLLREGSPLGAIMIRHAEARPFSDRQIALLETFADQAVIAIENTRLFEALQDKGRELELASKHKSEFLANMSHELRTPLNAIIGFSEVLAEQIFGDLNDKQLEYQQDILSSGQHLLSLINDILDLSKVEAGRMELEPGTFSLREALENGLTMLKERAGRHGITLTLDIEPGLDVIEADERKVKQVVFNLLSNAVKFTPDGGRVEVLARRAAGEFAVSVRDTGIGIAPEDLPHVFDEFRQVGGGAAKAEGTGLGLALAKKLVELHGGRIWMESEPGVGSTCSFALPLRPTGGPDGAGWDHGRG